MANAADPGRGYREKKRQAELTGSVDAKRALAEESLKRGYFGEAVELYESAMQGPLGDSDPALLKGLGRAKLLSGDGAEAERLFLKLREVDPAAFDADVELDFARALESQGKNDAAVRQYESVASRYPGEEARCRFALLLERLGQEDRAQALFREILKAARRAELLSAAPGGVGADRAAAFEVSRHSAAACATQTKLPRYRGFGCDQLTSAI